MLGVNERVIAGVITELVKQTVNPIKDYISKKWSKSEFKSEIELIDAYEKYLTKSKEKYSKIKTLLYKRTPKNIYSFYEDLNVRYEDELIDTNNIESLISIGNRIIITGTGGIGKSTMMKHFFQNSIDMQYIVPILIELRNLNDKFKTGEIDLLNYIYETMSNLDFKTDKLYLEYSLETGKNIILFDGLDEVKGDLINDVVLAIKDFSDRYNKCPIIITSRPSDVFMGWNDYIEVEACPLNKQQALALINKLEFEDEVKTKFYMELDERLYDNYESFASIPLLLTIMLITYDNSADMPNELHEFYEQAFSALFHTHDASKSGYKRDISTKLSYERFKLLFSHFCFQSYLNSDYIFTQNKLLGYIKKSKDKFETTSQFTELDVLEDLIYSVCMIMKDGLDYVFSHRSFQEYFAAVYTTTLTDEVQQKLFNEIIYVRVSCFGNRYIEILEQIQKNRFIKNCIYSKAKLIKELFDKKEIFPLFELFYKQIIFENESIAMVIQDNGNLFVLDKTINYMDSIRGNWSTEKMKNLFYKVQGIKPANGGRIRLDVREIFDMGLLDELLDAINFYLDLQTFNNWFIQYEEALQKVNNTNEDFLNNL
ncbi:AAA family ATPase [Lysinibacillus fusiformis]|uniref:NACHT domain-containing protein n=1 Tax=Lysinibacillus fusiformis TaxID=28031 RepID=UPI001967FC3F|nr:NB-ARC domain-containing protein [Lysinibacillus fusiformis]QSB11975.1 AAA family ATPase [Lysinibacillus fusiformis]